MYNIKALESDNYFVCDLDGGEMIVVRFSVANHFKIEVLHFPTSFFNRLFRSADGMQQPNLGLPAFCLKKEYSHKMTHFMR